MNTRKRIYEVLFLLILSLIWFGIGWTVHGRWSAANDRLSLIREVQQILDSQYVAKIPTEDEQTYAALRGMIETFDDPDNAFLEPRIAAKVKDDFDGQSGVIGLYPEKIDGEFIVSGILPGGEAEAAGIQVGDVILAIDGYELDSLNTSAELTLLMRGPVNTPTKLLVRRDEEEMEYLPMRVEFPVISDEQILEGNVAYIAQQTFNTNSPEEMIAALERLLAVEPKAIIWDLRNNGGGSILAAQEIISFFIEDGLLFSAVLKDGETQTFDALGETVNSQIPLFVLVGENTFSAAETSASAIQDRQRGVLIGGTTYGKGTVKSTVNLAQDSALQFTVARWLSPNGEWYDGRGLEPDFKVPDDPATIEDETLQFTLEMIQDLAKE